MRGERNMNNIYFKVKDIMKYFNLPNLYTTLIDKRYDNYRENIHYKYFILNE